VGDGRGAGAAGEGARRGGGAERAGGALPAGGRASRGAGGGRRRPEGGRRRRVAPQGHVRQLLGGQLNRVRMNWALGEARIMSFRAGPGALLGTGIKVR
jgi:hypothetical protein